MHVEKFTKGALFGLLAHNERKFERHSNENIDPAKKGQDYAFTQKGRHIPIEAAHGQKRYEEIISRCKVQNRKDVNTLCSVCLHLPDGVSPEEEDRFFLKSFMFLKRRYAQYDNIVSAVVHRDEERPHLHFVFVPVTKDTKKDRLKVCAKNVVNRTDLKTLHKDLSDYLEQCFGRDMGVYLKQQEDPQNDLQAVLRQIKNKIPPKEYKSLIEAFKTLQAYGKNLQHEVAELETQKSELSELIARLKKNTLFQEYEKQHLAESILDDEYKNPYEDISR